jgi:hypothetical protein
MEPHGTRIIVLCVPQDRAALTKLHVLPHHFEKFTCPGRGREREHDYHVELRVLHSLGEQPLQLMVFGLRRYSRGTSSGASSERGAPGLARMKGLRASFSRYSTMSAEVTSASFTCPILPHGHVLLQEAVDSLSQRAPPSLNGAEMTALDHLGFCGRAPSFRHTPSWERRIACRVAFNGNLHIKGALPLLANFLPDVCHTASRNHAQDCELRLDNTRKARNAVEVVWKVHGG